MFINILTIIFIAIPVFLIYHLVKDSKPEDPTDITIDRFGEMRWPKTTDARGGKKIE
jgi:hypothetical protein